MTRSKRDNTLHHKERYSVPSGTARLADAPDIHRELWNEGLQIAKSLTGKPLQKARTFVGKLRQFANDDSAVVLKALRMALETRPIDPEPWLIACVKERPETFKNAARALPKKSLPGEPEQPLPFDGVTLDATAEIIPLRKEIAHG